MSHPAEQINQTNWSIAHDNHDEAIASISRTLKTLNMFLSGDCHSKITVPMESERGLCGEEIDQLEKCASSTPSTLTGSFDYDYFSLPTNPSFVKVGESTCIEMDNDRSRTYDTNFVVFREPIRVLSHKTLDNQVCQELTYVCLYNLALSYHLKSFETEPGSVLQTAYLRKALSIYELSQMLQTEKTMTIRVNAYHSMALVSNLRHIHYELGHTEMVDLCSQHLVSTLMYLVSCGEASVLGSSMDAFFDTLLPLLSKSITASAA